MTTEHLSQRTRRTKVAFQVAAGVAFVLVLALLVAALYYLVQNARQGQATRTLLIECTVPPQERTPPVKVTDPLADCYTRAQSQQASVIGDPPAPINNVVILAAACADRAGVDTEAEIRVCVLEGLR